MHKYISDTAKYGDLTRGPRVVNDKTKDEMRKILKEIQKGKFARQWIRENASGRKKYDKHAEGRPEPPDREGRRTSCARACPGSTRDAPEPGTVDPLPPPRRPRWRRFEVNSRCP